LSYIHCFFECPRLGLLLETQDEDEVAQKMKDKIVKQLSEMTLEKFKKYCRFEIREVVPSDFKGSGPTHTY